MGEEVLPYGPTMTRLLDPLLRVFRVVNRRFAVPALEAGLGSAIATSTAGSILVLRTVGRRTGQVRRTPLGYAVLDGRVVVVAGYGRRADWFRNAIAHPEVEVVLPGAVLRGLAEEVTEPVARRAAFRAAIAAMGLVGRATVGDLRDATPERLDELATGFPVLAITPTAVLPGPFDPGGWAPRATTAAWLIGPLVLAAWLVRRARRG